MKQHQPNSNPQQSDTHRDVADAGDDGESSDDAAVSSVARATAYHEAGHAVMAEILGRPIEKVTIVAAQLQTGGFRSGMCKVQKGRKKPAQKDELEDDVLILLAGMVAESFTTGRYCENSANSDFGMVERLLANRARNQKQLERLCKRYLDKTEYLLAGDAQQLAVELVAKELLARETISGRTVRHMVELAERKFS